MVHQRSKDLLFFLVRPPLRILSGWYRLTGRWWVRGRPLRLHLGCGGRYLHSFINIDANPFRKMDLWLDLRNPLPFPDEVVEGIYTLETLEHLYPDELERLLSECLRVLKPGAFIRIGVPNLRRAVEAYVAQEAPWFSDWPRSYKSLGGRLSNFLLCDGQHRNALDFSMLEELLRRVGFTDIEESERGKSRWIESELVSNFEFGSNVTEPTRLVYVEARRPQRGESVKILVDCSTAKMGGARTYLEEFLRAVGGLQDHASWIFYGPPGCRTFLGKYSSFLDLRELPCVFSTPLGYFYWLQLILPRVIRQEGIDVVFASTGFGMLAPPCPELLLVRNPIYFSQLYIKKIRNLRVRFQVGLRRWLSLKVIQHSDAVLFPTQAMRDLVARHLSPYSLRCIVAPYGCDAELFRRQSHDASWLPATLLQARGRFLLNVSLYCHQKNFTVLLKALGILRRQGFTRPLVFTAHLKSAANTNFREDQSILRQQDLGKQVIQLGPVPRERLPSLYREAGLFVFPSYVESFGHPLAEAMAAGLPILAADTPVNREICGESALYAKVFDPEDWAQKITEILEDESLQKRLREQAHTQVQRFSWKEHVEAVLKAAEALVEAP